MKELKNSELNTGVLDFSLMTTSRTQHTINPKKKETRYGIKLRKTLLNNHINIVVLLCAFGDGSHHLLFVVVKLHLITSYSPISIFQFGSNLPGSVLPLDRWGSFGS